jgi:hypothetical protein
MSVCCILEVCCDEPAAKKAVDLMSDLDPEGTEYTKSGLLARLLERYRLVPRDLDPATQGAITAIVTAHLKAKGIPTTEEG